MIDRKWVNALLADAKTIEVRHLPSCSSTLCTTVDQVAETAARLAKSGDLYTSLNRPHADHVGTIKNESIERIVFLVFDFDPIRPKGTNSTAEELAVAIEERDRLVKLLLAKRWPLPALGMSGNGAHAIYRIFGANTREIIERIKSVYRLLAARFDSETVHFDMSVSNPGRIWRLYGTVNRKGPHTADRPQRVSSVQIPADWRRVTLAQIEALANEAELARPAHMAIRSTAPINGAGDYTTLDVVGWFADHGMYRRHIGGNVHEVDCPWEYQHSISNPADTIVQALDGNGWPGFFCHHDHCAGRQIRDVMALWGDADAYCTRQFGR